MNRCVNDIFLYCNRPDVVKPIKDSIYPELTGGFSCLLDPKQCKAAKTQNQQYGKGVKVKRNVNTIRANKEARH